MKFIKKIKTFFSCSTQTKFLILESIFFLAINRFLLLTFKFKKISKNWSKLNSSTNELADDSGYLIAQKISFIVTKTASMTPWESKCLVQSMTAQKMMKRRKHSTILYLGLAKKEGSLIAHSWLRYGDFYITGGNGSDFTILSSFYNI